MSIILEPYNAALSSPTNFQSQLATLKRVGIYEDSIVMLRSFLYCGSSTGVSFDPVVTNADSTTGWKFLEQLIDEHGIIGDLHTHQDGDFTDQDMQTIRGFAKAYGKKYLYHGVYCEGVTHWICAHMINGQVIIYDFGKRQDDMGPVVVLPTPLSIKQGDGFLIVPC